MCVFDVIILSYRTSNAIDAVISATAFESENGIQRAFQFEELRLVFDCILCVFGCSCVRVVWNRFSMRVCPFRKYGIGLIRMKRACYFNRYSCGAAALNSMRSKHSQLNVQIPSSATTQFLWNRKQALKMKIDTYTHAEFCTFWRLLQNDDCDDDDDDRLFIN